MHFYCKKTFKNFYLNTFRPSRTTISSKDKDIMGNILNRTLPSLHGGSLKITLTILIYMTDLFSSSFEQIVNMKIEVVFNTIRWNKINLTEKYIRSIRELQSNVSQEVNWIKSPLLKQGQFTVAWGPGISERPPPSTVLLKFLYFPYLKPKNSTEEFYPKTLIFKSLYLCKQMS